MTDKQWSFVDCDHRYTKVIDSRTNADKDCRQYYTRRRRICVDCGHRFSTLEIPITHHKGQAFMSLLDEVRSNMAGVLVNRALDSAVEALENLRVETGFDDQRDLRGVAK